MASPALAQAADITIRAVDRESGASLSAFRFIVNEDNAHENAAFVRPASYSPIVASGDDASATVSLPDGKYLVTVLGGPFPATPDAGGYKLWGHHFTVAGASKTVTVQLVKNPLPTSTLRVRVFHDKQVNATDDVPAEDGLGGFRVILRDSVGEVTVDHFNEPICGGVCISDSEGWAVIPRLSPGKYKVEVLPPDGSGWIQTTTIEGGFGFDVWLEEGSDGFSTEEGFIQGAAWFGFVKACSFGDKDDSCSTNDVAGDNTVVGRIRTTALVKKPGQIELGAPVFRPYIALNNLGGNDEQVWTGRGNPDGTFTIPDVPDGQYELVFWDRPLDHIIQFHNISVPGGTVVEDGVAGQGVRLDLGDLGIPRWFGTIKGYVFLDNGIAMNGTVLPVTPPFLPPAGNGVRDCYDDGSDDDADGIANELEPDDIATCERGIPGQDLDVRHKDGTIQYATFSDANGYYEFPEYFEWEHFLVWEVGYGRMAQTGTRGYRTDNFGQPIGNEEKTYPNNPISKADGLGGLLQAQNTLAGLYNWIDTGKRPHGSGENGGIAGIVYYATTRNEFDPRLAAAEDYEPGIPGVTVNLYRAVLDANGDPVVGPDGSLTKGIQVNSVETDSFLANHPSNCKVPKHPLGVPAFDDPLCLELPRLLNQIKSGVFDGGYAFEEDCSGKKCVALPAGTYIAEVVPPPGYRVITEADQNTDQGDDIVPAFPPVPCAGALHLVDDERNPAHGTNQPFCDSKLVVLEDGVNAESNFFLMTEGAVPIPGRIRGAVFDDLIVGLNPESPTFGDKRGVPFTPVGILDFAGNEITTVFTDAEGRFEVMLPSSYTALCPIPSGICPGIYQVVGNYPGSDPAHPLPGWSPDYGTLLLPFDVWPGRTTYVDIAIFPITGFVQTPGSAFAQPPACKTSGGPELFSVSQPYGSSEDAGAITITGRGFGTSGEVTLDGTPLATSSWLDTAIEIPFASLASVPAGPRQLLIKSGTTGVTGITFHVLGAGYDPRLHHVGEGQTYASIQDGLDAAADGDLVLVHPGTYFESVIVGKNVKLQGYGPRASVVDGRFFNFGGTTPAEFAATIKALDPDGPALVPMGQTVTVVAKSGQFGPGFKTQIDGFTIQGGSRVRGNRVVDSQGGGVYAHAYAKHLVVSNNVIQGNGGNLGGGVVLGRAYTNNPDAGNKPDAENDSVRIHHNHILNNGGIGLAGGIGIFNGAQGYEIDHNVICGNYSGEYGAGISHFGMSPGGLVHDNQILFNYAFDEGGGILVAGELEPLAANRISAGSGAVTIRRNRIQSNVTNDDGGGIRLLQPVDGPVAIENNLVVNNVAADIGGGVSLDDALAVTVVNNTIAKNLALSTAEDADRTTCDPPKKGGLASCPHGAGLVSEPHSASLMAIKKPAKDFSDAVIKNNIFWQNQSYFLNGIDDASPLSLAGTIDVEVAFTVAPRCFSASNSIFTGDSYPRGCSTAGSGNLIATDPLFLSEVTTQFVVNVFAKDPRFVSVLIKTAPDDPQGDYHLRSASPAIDAGTSAGAPADDFDGDARPLPAGGDFDIGADEFNGVAGAGGPIPGGSAPQGETSGGVLPDAGPQPTARSAEAQAVRPAVRSLGATARKQRVVVRLRAENCKPCRALVKLRVRGKWRTAQMRRSGVYLVGTLRNVPRGRWAYFASLRDLDTGLTTRTAMRRVVVR